MIYSYEQLKDKARIRFENGLLIKTEDQYQLDQGELQRWRDSYADMCDKVDRNITLMADIFAYCATYISFEKFLAYLLNSYRSFLDTNGKKDYIMYYQNERKSNFWISQILVFYGERINDKYKPPSYIINDIAEFTNSLTNTGKSIEDYVILLCDDASYSGEQLCDLLDDIFTATDANLEIAVLASAMTNLAARRIKEIYKKWNCSKGINVYYEFALKTIPAILREKLEDKKLNRRDREIIQEWSETIKDNVTMNEILTEYFTDFSTFKENNGSDFYGTIYNILINIPVYFEHKLPDSASSFPSMFLGYISQKCEPHSKKNFNIIKNCKLSEKSSEIHGSEGSSIEDDCAKPFYKIEVPQNSSGGGKKNKKGQKKNLKKRVIYVI
jgi:hypothetical protein